MRTISFSSRPAIQVVQSGLTFSKSIPRSTSTTLLSNHGASSETFSLPCLVEPCLIPQEATESIKVSNNTVETVLRSAFFIENNFLFAVTTSCTILYYKSDIYQAFLKYSWYVSLCFYDVPENMTDRNSNPEVYLRLEYLD